MIRILKSAAGPFFETAVAQYRAALEAHQLTEDVPAPTAAPEVMAAVIRVPGEDGSPDSFVEEYELLDDPPPAPPPRPSVPKRLIIERLRAAGKLNSLAQKLNDDFYLREVWGSQLDFFADDETIVGLVTDLGETAAGILAPAE